jgi:hypothetical protein
MTSGIWQRAAADSNRRRVRTAAFVDPRGASAERLNRLRWPASFRNGGRLQIGFGGRTASEFATEKSLFPRARDIRVSLNEGAFACRVAAAVHVRLDPLDNF